MATTERIRLDKFVIDELSAVDRPAQTGAVMTLLKRDGGPFRELSRAEKVTIQAASSTPMVHDDATQKVLDAGFLPLTAREQEHHSTLSGEERRRFVLAKTHSERTISMMAAAEEADAETPKDDPMPAYATTKDEAAAYDKFSDAVDRIAKEEGLSKMEAMIEARKRDPASLEKGRYSEAGRLYDDLDVRKAVDDGHAVQGRIDGAVAKLMGAGLGRMAALREVRRTSPELFD